MHQPLAGLPPSTKEGEQHTEQKHLNSHKIYSTKVV